MKTISIALDAHYRSGTNTVARCWKVTRTDGQVFGFTETDTPLLIDGLVYSAVTGLTPSAMTEASSLAVGNMNMSGFLSGPSVTVEDIRAGLWDYATLELFTVNFRDLTMGKLPLMKGHFGQVQTGRTMFTVELRNLSQAYSRSIGELTSPGCRADLGDARCKVNLAPFTFMTTVDSVSGGNRTIAAAGLTQADSYFTFGKVTFTSGLNAGLSMEVKAYTVGVFSLQMPMPYAIAAGDTFTISAGCDKSKATCRDRFSNILNMRAEPDLPGQDKVLQVGGQAGGSGTIDLSVVSF